MNGGGNMNDTQPDNGNNNTTDIGNFGSCSIPQIQFGAGFDGRRETSFEPVDKGKLLPALYSLEGHYANAVTLGPQ